MLKWTLTVVLFVVTLISDAQNVSLDSCRNMAIRNNKILKMADEEIIGTRYAKKAAMASYLPGIDFTAAYTYNQNKIELLGEDAMLPTMTFNPKTQSYDYNILINPLDGTPITNPETGSPIPTEVAVIPKEALSYDVHNVVAGAITLTQPVYMGGQIRAMNSITKYAEELAQSMRNSKIQEIVYAVDEAYWLVVSLSQKKKLAESFVKLVDTLKYNVEAMFEAGLVTRSEVLMVNVKCNEAEIALAKVNNGLVLSKMSLSQICGLPIDTYLSLQDEELMRLDSSALEYSYNIEDIYARRQDLQSLRTGIRIFEQKEKLAMSEMLPKLLVTGVYTFSNPNVIHGFEKRFGGGFSIGAMLSVPIWHWGQNYNKYRVAKSQTNVQRLQLADIEEKLELQVKQARFKYEEAFKTYDMTVVNLAKADENIRQAEIGFKEGVLTTDDVIRAQTAWLQANSEKIDAEIGIQLCKVYLSKVLGTMTY